MCGGAYANEASEPFVVFGSRSLFYRPAPQASASGKKKTVEQRKGRDGCRRFFGVILGGDRLASETFDWESQAELASRNWLFAKQAAQAESSSFVRGDEAGGPPAPSTGLVPCCPAESPKGGKRNGVPTLLKRRFDRPVVVKVPMTQASPDSASGGGLRYQMNFTSAYKNHLISRMKRFVAGLVSAGCLSLVDATAAAGDAYAALSTQPSSVVSSPVVHGGAPVREGLSASLSVKGDASHATGSRRLAKGNRKSLAPEASPLILEDELAVFSDDDSREGGEAPQSGNPDSSPVSEASGSSGGDSETGRKQRRSLRKLLQRARSTSGGSDEEGLLASQRAEDSFWSVGKKKSKSNRKCAGGADCGEGNSESATRSAVSAPSPPPPGVPKEGSLRGAPVQDVACAGSSGSSVDGEEDADWLRDLYGEENIPRSKGDQWSLLNCWEDSEHEPDAE
ncbi:hypothetical protein BESB_072420 [Besnoitia besnoiti]|uniref:Uncharacterized protein n=1 Tax=Besnoitia besnoiti TaxID=94643 RepID=A0A2A9MFD6_BESBE|nr:uncharacterized protein BESB_072420 [Besnoitia besnoiti]PFH34090.1 hypothetical protein BESB_072420 [Besnoitia besnoiti]